MKYPTDSAARPGFGNIYLHNDRVRVRNIHENRKVLSFNVFLTYKEISVAMSKWWRWKMVLAVCLHELSDILDIGDFRDVKSTFVLARELKPHSLSSCLQRSVSISLHFIR